MPQFTCQRLKEKLRIWRVDGIGTVRPSTYLGARVNYLFSEIKPHLIETADNVLAPTGRVYLLKGHAGWLRLFTPGSVWVEGRKTISPATLSLALTIDTRACIYTLPDKIPSDFAPLETLLPKSHLEYHDNRDHLANTLFALLPVPSINNSPIKWLIVPASEIFRYYVGASSRLLAAALTNTVKNRLIESAKLKDGRVTIRDHVGNLTKLEACVIARTLVSDAAAENFYGPHKHLVLNRMKNGDPTVPLYINSRFPFLGQTTLHFSGKKISLKNLRTSRSEPAVLVTQIRNCSHPLGFSGLTVICTGFPTGSSKPGSLGGGPPRPPKKEDIEDSPEINGEPADPSLGRAITRNPVAQYEQINSIKFNKEYISPASPRGKPHQSQTPVTGATFEDGKNGADGSGNQGVDDMDTSVKSAERELLPFLSMLKELRIKTANWGWVISTVGSENSEKVDGEAVMAFPEMGGRFSWYRIYSDPEDKVGRPRKVILVRITIADEYIHLIEMELRSDERSRSVLAVIGKKSDKSPVQFTLKDFGLLLELTARHNGWPPSTKKWSEGLAKKNARLFEEFRFERLHHLYVVAEKKAEPAKDAPNPAGKSTNERDGQKKPIPVDPQAWADDILSKIVQLVG